MLAFPIARLQSHPSITRVIRSTAMVLEMLVDVSYAALQAQGIVNVALHQVYSLGIVFIFS
jgi:hypothetical protein